MGTLDPQFIAVKITARPWAMFAARMRCRRSLMMQATKSTYARNVRAMVRRTAITKASARKTAQTCVRSVRMAGLAILRNASTRVTLSRKIARRDRSRVGLCVAQAIQPGGRWRLRRARKGEDNDSTPDAPITDTRAAAAQILRAGSYVHPLPRARRPGRVLAWQ